MSSDDYITIHNHPGSNGGYCWIPQSASAEMERTPYLDHTRFETLEEAVADAIKSWGPTEYGFQFRLTEPESVQHVTVLALCEQDMLVLKPNVLYRFEVVEGCRSCAALAPKEEGEK